MARKSKNAYKKSSESADGEVRLLSGRQSADSEGGRGRSGAEVHRAHAGAGRAASVAS